MNLKFFEALYADQEFSEALGRMTLAGGRFESRIREFLMLNNVAVSENDATLGSLISKLEKHGLISENGIQVLRDIKSQRNYLTHSLFGLLSGQINETILPRTDLVPMDVMVFTDKVRQLEQNLAGLSIIVEKGITEMRDGTDRSTKRKPLLFSPGKFITLANVDIGRTGHCYNDNYSWFL